MKALAGSLLLAGLLALNEPPRVELEPRACADPQARPRVCAQAVDDHGVARVRALFRAAGTRDFWATEMTFDGARYCAWLPRPLPRTRAVDYYVEAFDDEFEISRTRTETLPLRAGCPDPEPQGTAPGPAVVEPTVNGQPPLPSGVDPAGVRAKAPPKAPASPGR